MASKKNRQTFEKFRREQAVREKRARKLERAQAARVAKAMGLPPAWADQAAPGAEGTTGDADPGPAPEATS